MKTTVTFLFGLFFSSFIFAQSTRMKVDYDNDSRWFWTLNAGATWSTADVAKKFDAGYGLTIGKSFNYNYGKVFSFDIRGRYLYGNWYGQNTDTTGFEYPNAALSSGNTNYDSILGYSVLNFESEQHRLALELVIHANNLRANTGLDLYVFGGAGFTWRKTYGDLLNTADSNSTYAYDQLADYNKGTLSALLDKDYETVLDGSEKNKFTGAFAPSVGFGIGYQFAPRFSMGLEHKTTFTLDDTFDGSVNPTGKYKNDWYHYTSIYLRFHIKDHAKVRETPPNTLSDVPNYNQAQQFNQPPVVTFTNPSVSGTTVNARNYTVGATIQNVASNSNVVFRQNGAYINAFTFNPTSQQFESNVTLDQGQNVFELTGTNTIGSDQKQTIVIYNREQQNPPVVTYVNPSSSPTNVQSASYNLSATVINVTQSNQITVKLNGQAVGFNFNASTSSVGAVLNLQVGTNIVTTTGTNTYGSDAESVTIIYNPQQQTQQPPVVYFVDPNVSPYSTTQSSFNIKAEVMNVAGAQKITFKQNGTVNTNFTYNSQSDDFASSVVLTAGQNVFEIIGTNTAGSASATMIIVSERQAPRPPIVSFTNPVNNPQEVSSAFFNLGATILNVTQASQIKVKLNGNAITNFNYNASNSSITAGLTLVQGANVITVTGTNTDGTDSKQTTLIFKPQTTIQPPVVTFIAPNVDPYTINQASFSIVASVTNVSIQSGVNVNVNGANFTGFTFNASNGQITFPLTLIEGANVITITGTNTAGTDSEQQTIIYRKPQQAQPPVVSFITPSVNPTEVYSQTTTVDARVRYVQNSSQIMLKINGQTSTSFTYSASSELMNFTTGLVVGANVVEIKATNSAGQDQESTTIIYKAPELTNPPVVTITNPQNNPTTVSTSTTPIVATVLNVAGSSNITVSVNGLNVAGFTYSTLTKQLNFTMNLIQGSNNVVITGTNTAGTASDSRTIIYVREQAPSPPLVTFINPTTSGTTVSNAGLTIKATVTNVNLANQIIVSQDGQIISTSLWNFNPSTKEVTFNTNLNSGNNIFTVSGTNTAGSHSSTTNILYTPPITVCDKPVISFISPVNAGLEVLDLTLTVSAKIQNITSANQVQVFLNGALLPIGVFTVATQTFTKPIILIAGQNSIEIVATNDCGQTKLTTTIVFKPIAAPCNAPVLQRILPLSIENVLELAQIGIKASVSNVSNANQLSMTINGSNVPFNFDLGTQLITSTISLNLGDNTIVLKAQTDCGTTLLEWKANRKPCAQPMISITSSTVADGVVTLFESISVVASITDVQEQSDITVTLNGQPVGFVFNAQTGVLTINHALVVGVNKIEIKATNACSTISKVISVTRKLPPPPKPPEIRIVTPNTTPYNTQQSGMSIDIYSQGAVASSQISVTVNGLPQNFNFNAGSGAVEFNANFQVGANVIVATIVTTAGTDTDTKTVVYTAPVVVSPPVINLISPLNCPAVFPRGTTTITGTVSNISNPNQLSILYNGTAVNFTSTVVGNSLTFSFNVSIGITTINLPIVITATNEAGVVVETCLISLTGVTNTNGENGNTVPVIGNDGNGGNADPNNSGGGSGDGGKPANLGKPGVKPTIKPKTTPTPAATPTPTTTPVIKPKVGTKP